MNVAAVTDSQWYHCSIGIAAFTVADSIYMACMLRQIRFSERPLWNLMYATGSVEGVCAVAMNCTISSSISNVRLTRSIKCPYLYELLCKGGGGQSDHHFVLRLDVRDANS